MTSYDRNTTPIRPARVITVSGPADRAISTVVSIFTVRGFRVTTPSGVVPLKLERGRWWAPFVVWGAGVANHGIVGVRIESGPDATVVVTILVLTSWTSRLFSPIFLAALDEAITVFRDAGVLVDAGPVVDAKALA